MFEEMTYDEILNRMLASVPNGLNTGEGSLIATACSKMAMELENAYLNMAIAYDNLYLSTQDEEHLIMSGQDRGLPIQDATQAILIGTFSQEIPIGSRFSGANNELNYITVRKISNYTYEMLCEQAGTEGNEIDVELDLIDYIDNYDGGTITAVLTPAAPRENIEVYRRRLLDLYYGKYFGGNRADYKRLILDINGVGAAKVPRKLEADPYIKVYILNSAHDIPDQTLIDAVQQQVDPTETTGQGDGIAPIGHKVKILPAAALTINITAAITYDTGYSQTILQTQINKAIDDYFAEIINEWQEEASQIVRVAKIDSAILEIDGILDIASTRLNGQASNITLQYEQIPKRGRVNNV